MTSTASVFGLLLKNDSCTSRVPVKACLTAAAMMCAAGMSGHAAAGGSVETAFTPDRDSAIFQNGNASGAGPLFGGRSGGGQRNRTLLHFDVSTIPAGATVTGVSVSLIVEQASGASGTVPIALHLALDSWGEGSSVPSGGSGAPPTPGDATWTNRFHPGDPWAVLGGDFAATPSSMTMSPPVVGQANTFTGGDLISDVQSWIDDPLVNDGWFLIGDESMTSTGRRWSSRESGASTNEQPVLNVTWMPPPCSGDGNGDGTVDFADIVGVTAAWGPCEPKVECAFDFDDSGAVDFADLLVVIAAFGPCPG